MGKLRISAGLLLGLLLHCACMAQPVPRTVVALYDGTTAKEPSQTRIHRALELPLNHLGLVVEYHDVRQPLPALGAPVRGIVVWLEARSVGASGALLDWLAAAMRQGKRVLLIGSPEFDPAARADPAAYRTLLDGLGIRAIGGWITPSYRAELTSVDSALYTYERPLPKPLPAADLITATNDAQVHLALHDGREGEEVDTALALTGPSGTYIAGSYALFENGEQQQRQWHINPFQLIRRTFATEGPPKPDTTTLAGRRIFYSHIDGDGWHNIAEIRQYKRTRTEAAEVILREVLERFPDLPVTVAPIAADLDSDWYGSTYCQQVARRIFQLPHIQVGSHTYTHPLDWSFFEAYTQGKEAAFVDRYPPRNPLLKRILSLEVFGVSTSPDEATGRRGHRSSHRHTEVVEHDPSGGYATPRSYALQPFDLEMEIVQSARLIERFAPAGKRAGLVQWSGNTRPFAAALSTARRNGLRNINGGDSRYDELFPSVSWLAPLSRVVGAERQIYASASNENTYTQLWSTDFFGYRNVIATFENSERPHRLKPINVYYHMYSGEKLASLNAVLEVLAWVQAQEIAPVAAADFAGIVEGFFSTGIEAIGPRRWRVLDRGELQTVRFDEHGGRVPDLARSRGVVGWRVANDALYVALDRADAAPEIALADPGQATDGYLVQSRWPIWEVQRAAGALRFRTMGFGAASMRWQMPAPGSYLVSAGADSRRITTGPHGELDVSLVLPPGEPVLVVIGRAS